MPGTGKRLLIVEDQELMAMTIAAIVRRLNYDLVGSAATAERALELAITCQPDVVLMDLHLKGTLDGVATAKEIAAYSNARIVFLTGAGNAEDMARMQSVSPAGIVIKPFRRTELTSVLTAASRSGPRACSSVHPSLAVGTGLPAAASSECPESASGGLLFQRLDQRPDIVVVA